MSDELVKSSEFKAASFKDGLVKSNKSTDIIIKLLVSATKENRQITINDIIESYLDFTFFDGRETVYRKALDQTYIWGPKSIRNGFVSREMMKERKSYLEKMAKHWFKKGLGEAILKGKLLAIPIIEID